jgi:hypothetical protein
VRCLFVLSADFGEFVTANVLSRGQGFERAFALPPRLAAYAGGIAHTVYRNAGDVEAIVEAARPDIVVLGSGYLYAINNLFGPQELATLLERLRARGCAIATTDPWLRLRAVRPDARFSIYSVQRGGIDPAQSERVLALQRLLESLLGELPHLLVVPAPRACPVFNERFLPPLVGSRDENDTWLFVLAREDLALAGGEAFFDDLAARIRDLLAVPGNRLRFIGPERIGQFLAARFAGEPRVEYLAFCDFDRFEEEVRRARVVAYWNVLSASALYCLYHGVAPVFFARGHQATVLEGLFEHALAHVYRGRPPLFLRLEEAFEADADALLGRFGMQEWLRSLRADYEKLPGPAHVMEHLCHRR